MSVSQTAGHSVTLVASLNFSFIHSSVFFFLLYFVRLKRAS